MNTIKISTEAAKLFAHTLGFYIKNQDRWYADLDDVASWAFSERNKLTRHGFELALLSENERDQEFIETDRDIGAWQARLDAWQFKRFYLRQYLNHLRQQLREVCHASAA